MTRLDLRRKHKLGMAAVLGLEGYSRTHLPKRLYELVKLRAALRSAGPDDAPRLDHREQPAVLTALVNAVSAGDVAQVVRLVSEDCVLWADGGGVVKAARHPVRGRERVANFLLSVSRIGESLERYDVNGAPAFLFSSAQGRYLYLVEHDGARVTGIQVHANPAKLAAIGTPA